MCPKHQLCARFSRASEIQLKRNHVQDTAQCRVFAQRVQGLSPVPCTVRRKAAILPGASQSRGQQSRGQQASQLDLKNKLEVLR